MMMNSFFVLLIPLLFFGFVESFDGMAFAQESSLHGGDVTNFDDYTIVENVSLNQDCSFGMFAAYKVDNSKVACVFPDTLRELVSRGWAFPHANHGSWKIDGHTSATVKETCPEKNHILVNGGYYPTRGFDLDFEYIERVTVDGYSGVSVSLYNPMEGDLGTAKFGNANVFVDCLAPNVKTFYECQEASHYTDVSNWPILECRTLDGKRFYIDENVEMSKNSGIELYTMNYLNDNTLEFVGKTDRIDEQITFVVTTPDGNDVSEWTEFAPAKGEFRTSISVDSSWNQDGIYIFTAKQTDIPYYTVYLEFQVTNGKIIR